VGQKLLTVQDLKPGIQKVTLDVEAAYPDRERRRRFDERFLAFLNSHELHPRIFERAGDMIIYRTECIIPRKQDLRSPLLLVFGNPASQSVYSEMFFACEGSGQEHRFWKILRAAGILAFPSAANGDRRPTLEKSNQLRKNALYELCYESPFRIGLAVFYTMPSGASGPWAGVAGLRRLFGTQALRRICKCEKDRVNGLIRGFVTARGAVITFQKDAYLGIRSLASPDYALDEAKAGRLIGACQCDPNIMLLCCPPTRLLHGAKSLALLRDFIGRIRTGET